MEREWLKNKRIENGMTLETLAKRVNVSWQAIGYYEKGQRTPKPKVAKKIGAILGFDWTLFFADDDRGEAQDDE